MFRVLSTELRKTNWSCAEETRSLVYRVVVLQPNTNSWCLNRFLGSRSPAFGKVLKTLRPYKTPAKGLRRSYMVLERLKDFVESWCLRFWGNLGVQNVFVSIPFRFLLHPFLSLVKILCLFSGGFTKFGKFMTTTDAFLAIARMLSLTGKHAIFN
jgi:hypothetical protein